MTRTCATCPFARQIDRDRYVCEAVHNHHNPVVRGHWEATADCNQAITQTEQVDSDVDYVMNIEASLEKSEEQATQQQQFSQITSTAFSDVEIDSVLTNVYRVWMGRDLVGTIHRKPKSWVAHPAIGKSSRHDTPVEAQLAVVNIAQEI